MDLRGSKTEQNLLAAFAGESMASNRYIYHAAQAKQEGYEQIKGVFEETAQNEREHAKRIFKFLGGNGNTAENLKSAASGEHEEWAVLYKEMEQVAREEGFISIADFFKEVATVEEAHEKRFLALLKLLEEENVFRDTEQTVWICRNCGYIYVGAEPPKSCPVCLHPQAFFERKATNNYS
jgi:rubrerythrin